MYYQIRNEECAVSSTEKGIYCPHIVHVDTNDQKKISMHKWSLNKKTHLFELTVTSGVRTEAMSPSHRHRHRHRHDTISEL